MAITTTPALKPKDFEVTKSRIKHNLDNLPGDSWKVAYEIDWTWMRVTMEPIRPRALDINETFSLAAALHEAKLTTHDGVRVVAYIKRSKPVVYKGKMEDEIKSRLRSGLDMLVKAAVMGGKRKMDEEGKVARKGAWNEVWKEWNESLTVFFEDGHVKEGDFWYVKK